MCPKTCSAAPLPIQLPFLGMPGHTRTGRRRPRGHPLASEVVGRGEEVIVSGLPGLGGVRAHLPRGPPGPKPLPTAFPKVSPATPLHDLQRWQSAPRRIPQSTPAPRIILGTVLSAILSPSSTLRRMAASDCGRSRWRWSRGSPRTPRAQLSPGKHLRCACTHASSHAWGRTLSACPRIRPERLSTALAAEFASPHERLQTHDSERLHGVLPAHATVICIRSASRPGTAAPHHRTSCKCRNIVTLRRAKPRESKSPT